MLVKKNWNVALYSFVIIYVCVYYIVINVYYIFIYVYIYYVFQLINYMQFTAKYDSVY